uniref:Uncharacterized protein n=1 Tax=Rhizophora mucronata TaxID=61149 RepID=A0A2P2R4D8_RHIMU
MTCTAFEGTL